MRYDEPRLVWTSLTTGTREEPVVQDPTTRPIGDLIPTCVCLLLQYLIQSCARGGRRIVEDMCYEIRRAEACVD
jgi:hypothetical protein